MRGGWCDVVDSGRCRSKPKSWPSRLGDVCGVDATGDERHTDFLLVLGAKIGETGDVVDALNGQACEYLRGHATPVYQVHKPILFWEVSGWIQFTTTDT